VNGVQLTRFESVKTGSLIVIKHSCFDDLNSLGGRPVPSEAGGLNGVWFETNDLSIWPEAKKGLD